MCEKYGIKLLTYGSFVSGPDQKLSEPCEMREELTRISASAEGSSHPNGSANPSPKYTQRPANSRHLSARYVRT